MRVGGGGPRRGDAGGRVGWARDGAGWQARRAGPGGAVRCRGAPRPWAIRAWQRTQQNKAVSLATPGACQGPSLRTEVEARQPWHRSARHGGGILRLRAAGQTFSQTLSRYKRHVSCGSHGTHMLYLDGQHDPVRLTGHFRGTRESEQKKDRHSPRPAPPRPAPPRSALLCSPPASRAARREAATKAQVQSLGGTTTKPTRRQAKGTDPSLQRRSKSHTGHRPPHRVLMHWPTQVQPF